MEIKPSGSNGGRASFAAGRKSAVGSERGFEYPYINCGPWIDSLNCPLPSRMSGS